MSDRLFAGFLATCAVLLAGCGNSVDAVSTATATPPTSATPSAVAVAGRKLDPDACAKVTSANLDLAVASTAKDAQAAADVFSRYTPPAKVLEAIDHFVGTGGVEFDDPDFDELNDRIDNWVKAVCPQ